MTETTQTQEPVIALPTTRLVVAVCGPLVLFALAWVAVSLALGSSGDVVMCGPVGAGVTAVIGVLGIMVMVPWRPRPIGWWATMWLAATVLRLLLTPVAAFLLYSATPLGGTPLMVAVATSYLLMLLSEAVVLSLHVRRST